MNKIIILMISLLVILAFVLVGCNTGQASFAKIPTTQKQMCNPAKVTNGEVAAYPICSITCKSGYALFNKNCTATCTGTFPVGSYPCVINETPSIPTPMTLVPACNGANKCQVTCNANAGYLWNGTGCQKCTRDCSQFKSYLTNLPSVCKARIINGLTSVGCGDNCITGDTLIGCALYNGNYSYSTWRCMDFGNYNITFEGAGPSACPAGTSCVLNSGQTSGYCR